MVEDQSHVATGSRTYERLVAEHDHQRWKRSEAVKLNGTDVVRHMHG
jgi:hypothetical protein